MRTEKPVSCHAVIELIVVCARITVLVVGEVVLVSEEREKRPDSVVNQGPDQRAAEAAVVFGVVGEQGSSGGAHSREVRVVLAVLEVCPVLLVIAEVAEGAGSNFCRHRGKPRHRHRHRHALVERTQDDRLPSTAREPRHAQPRAVHVRVVREIVEALAHLEVEQPLGIRADQIQMRAKPVRILRVRKLAKREPFEVERQYPVLGEIDTPFLLVFNGLPQRPDVPVDVHDARNFPFEFFGLIEQRNGIKPGNDFVPQLANPIAPARLDHPHVFEFRCGIHPLRRPTMEDHDVEQLPAQAILLRSPLVFAGCRRRRRHTAKQILLQPEDRDLRRYNRLGENLADLLRLRLGNGVTRHEQQQRRQPYDVSSAWKNHRAHGKPPHNRALGPGNSAGGDSTAFPS